MCVTALGIRNVSRSFVVSVWDVGVESCKVRWLYAHKAGDALGPGSGSAVKFAKRFGGC